MYTEKFMRAVRANMGKDFRAWQDETSEEKYLTNAVKLYKEKNFVEAINMLTEAVEEYPNDFALRYNLGRQCANAYRNMGINLDELAEEHLLIAHQMREKDTICLYELGRFYTRQNRFEDAEEAFFNALLIKFDDPFTFFGLGLLYKNAKGFLHIRDDEEVMARGCFALAHDLSDPDRDIFDTTLRLLNDMENRLDGEHVPSDILKVQKSFQDWKNNLDEPEASNDNDAQPV